MSSKKNSTKGIGIGLALSKLIVKKFNGDIDFVTKHKQGSTFFFTFELNRAIRGFPKMDTSELMFSRGLSFAGGNMNKILVVDDEEFCLSVLKSLLQKSNIDLKYVDFCIDGQEAVDTLKYTYSKGGNYKIVFTDFNMPKLNGLESCTQMREHLYELEIPRDR